MPVRIAVPALLLSGALAFGAGSAAAQAEPSVRAYLRAAAAHAGTAPEEAELLAEVASSPEEVPLVLILSARSGVSPDVLMALRRGGRSSWAEIAGRYGLGAGTLHVPLQGAEPGPLLAGLYQSFAETPPRGWNSIRARDPEMIALANLGFLVRALGVSPERVLEARSRVGGWPEAWILLGGR